jgi:hypothetical protein
MTGIIVASCGKIEIDYDLDYYKTGQQVVFNEPMMYTNQFFEGVTDSKQQLIKLRLLHKSGEDSIPEVVRERHINNQDNPEIVYYEVSTGTSFEVDSSFLVKLGWFRKPARYLVLKDPEGTMSVILEKYVPI